MSLEVHRPYPGVALVVTDFGSVLIGAPTDAFKVAKHYCEQRQVPFPRVLVAPQRLLVGATPQFNPEFFLYDFLFVYGAAFKPELAGQRLLLVADEEQVQGTLRSLRMTLLGPSKDELSSYRDPGGQPILSAATIEQLVAVADHMAIKKDGLKRPVEEMVETRTFDKDGKVALFDGKLLLWRDMPHYFRVRAGELETEIDLSFAPPVEPFATLPVPTEAQLPETFAVKLLGARSGFDLSGPTTGFLFWLNGRALVYDGPVGVRYLLEHQGISGDDVEGIVLSHCHEDHMAAFVELLLAGERPRVYTAEPIYRSALVKLSSYFGKPEAEIASLIDYRRVTPGEPITLQGATLDFFYTVHAIPTLGMTVSMRHQGKTRQVQISGDTMHHDGLAKMHADGVISAEVHKRMRALIPEQRKEGALYFADTGEALIHGNPKDWQGNPNRVIYYHCPDNEKTRGFGHPVATPGDNHVLIKAAKLHPAVPMRVLKALRFLDLKEPMWLATLLFLGKSRKVEAGARLASEGEPDPGRRFSVIVSGLATAYKDNPDEPLLQLRPGEFFGAIELVDGSGRHTANLVATTPMELFDIDAAVLHECLRLSGLDEHLRSVWHQRTAVDSAKIFCSLDLAAKNALASVATEERYKPGMQIIAQNQTGTDFFVVLSGNVELERNGESVAAVRATDADNFFGEFSALYPDRPQPWTARAMTEVTTLRVKGEHLRKLATRNVGIRYAIQLAVDKR
ncbi:MAG: cyclic nucleotide-binding domain-containing protein [Deltaproteobacteria bacterium]|nr:cyclic nucleotide-binding domain-containing protein [Deltaproteobacteria bacterium]